MVRSCPKCKTNEYNCRNLVMMINECGHPLCQNCVENIFARNSNVCPHPGCGKTLKKNNFWEQIFDDPLIERESHIRKRLEKIYNLQENDFPSLREYNDYLEHYEEIVFKLVHDLDTDEVEVEINNFKESHNDLIDKNRKKLSTDDIWIKQMLEEEANRKKRLKAEVNTDTNNKKNALTVDPKAIINELRETDLPAEVILDRQRKLHIEAEIAEKEEAQKRKLQKQERQRRYQQDNISLAPIRRSGKPYHHVISFPQYNGPRLPSTEELENYGYLQHIVKSSSANIAGGYVNSIGCLRAIFESYQDLLVA